MLVRFSKNATKNVARCILVLTGLDDSVLQCFIHFFLIDTVLSDQVKIETKAEIFLKI